MEVNQHTDATGIFYANMHDSTDSDQHAGTYGNPGTDGDKYAKAYGHEHTDAEGEKQIWNAWNV